MDRSVSLTLSDDNYVAANRLHFLKSCRSRGALAAFAMLFVGYLIWMAIAYIDRWGTIAVMALNAPFAAVVLVMIGNYFLFVPIAARRNYRKHKALHRPCTYSWSETKLTVTSAVGEWQVPWSDYLKWDENAQIFILYQAPRLFNMMPKRALRPEQIVGFRQCASRIAA